MVTHEPSAAQHAQRVVVLRDGRVSGGFVPDAFDEPAALAAHYHALVR